MATDKDALNERDEKDIAQEAEDKEAEILESEQEGDGEEREAIRARRREERHERKERQRSRQSEKDREIARLSQRLDEMQAKLGEVAGGLNQGTRQQVDNAIRETERMIEGLKAARAKALTDLDPDGLNRTDDALYEARKRLDALNTHKTAAEKPPERRQEQAPDRDVMARANRWKSDNDWYDPSLGDQDSRIINSIEQQLLKEGFIARDPDYWDELNARKDKYLPHRRGSDTGSDDDDEPQNQRQQSSQQMDPPRKPPTRGGGKSSSGGNADALGDGRMAKLRREALEQAGIWKDPEKRKKYTSLYKQYDRENGPTR